MASSSKKYKYSGKDAKEGAKNIITLLAFVVVIMVAAALIFVAANAMKQPPAQNQTSNQTTTVTPPINLTCDDICWLTKAVDETSVYACDQIISNSTAQECYERLSALSLDACFKVADAIKKDACMKDNAVSIGSLEMCDQLSKPADREECKRLVDPCYGQTGTTRNLCLAKSKSDVLLCGTDEDCIMQYATYSKNAADCSVLNITSKKQACLSLIDGKDDCKWLAYPSERDQCYAIYAYWTNQSSLCNVITPDGPYAIECYQRFSILNHDPYLCNSLNLNNRWVCLYQYAIGADDPYGCALIDDLASFSKKSCFSNYARNNRNPGGCALLPEAGDKLGCYQSSVMYNSTLPIKPQNCGAITSDNWRDKCYQVSATGNNNQSICNYIVDQAYRQSCISTLSR